MSNTLSRAKTLAHIASIASKSKIEDSDVLFFKDGVYKGEWNPNAVANNLPANTQQNDIFLVSDTGSYYGRTLLVGDLVRFVGQDKPILVYSKYLPIPFFLSMLDECVVNRLLSDEDLHNAIATQTISSILTELENNNNGALAAAIGAIATYAVSAALTPPETPVAYITDTISELIANTTESSINDALNPASNGLIAVAIQDFVTAADITDSISTALDSALQTGGVIDVAIQTAINP